MCGRRSEQLNGEPLLCHVCTYMLQENAERGQGELPPI